jgi:hypothetical protein
MANHIIYSKYIGMYAIHILKKLLDSCILIAEEDI